MNIYLKILYGAIRKVIAKRHPYDEDLIGIIAEMFLDFDKEVQIHGLSTKSITPVEQYEGENQSSARR